MVSAESKRAEGLEDGIRAVEVLIQNSRGVVGLHLNGDEAPWDELLAGGQFEDWLRKFSLAAECLHRPGGAEKT